MATVTFTAQDVINRAGDKLGNYSSGQYSVDQKVRAVDSAVNYIKRLISLPQDETKHSFYYTSDTIYYDAPSDFLEAKDLFYNSTSSNFPYQGKRWEYRAEEELQVRTGLAPSTGNMWSDTNVNGKHQIMLLGSNQIQGQLLESFDVNLWTASGDASAASTDTTVKYQGTGSEKFTVSYSTGTATLTSGSVNWSLSQLVQLLGYLNIYLYMPSTSVTSARLRFYSSNSDYYEMSVSSQADGTAWSVNSWNKLQFSTSTATIVGSPNLDLVNKFDFSIVVPNTFGTVAGFRVDDFYTTYPDKMDLIYWSKDKALDANSGAYKSTVTSLTDQFYYDYDYIEPISTKVALYLCPQLRADKEWYQLFGKEFDDQARVWARSNPRKRVNKYRRTRLAR